jgi:putative sigma-54 modulation protein
MDIILSGKSLDLTPSMKTYVDEKLGRLEKFWSEIVRLHVELSVDHGHKQGLVHIAHAWIEVPGHDLSATTNADSMHAAIDMLYPKLERQIIKAKERRSDHRS